MFCPLTGWGFLLICPEIPAQLNSNFHSISCTVDFIPSHKEMPLSHWQAETERLWPLASIPIFPKEKHSLGWSTGFPLPCWRSSCWLEHSETSSRGCREIPLGCAFIFLLGVKVGRNKGETVPNGIPHSPFQKGNISGINSIAVACSSSAQAGKALTCAYFTNSNCTPAWFGYFGVMFANKKEKTAWAERIWWLHNYFGADLAVWNFWVQKMSQAPQARPWLPCHQLCQDFAVPVGCLVMPQSCCRAIHSAGTEHRAADGTQSTKRIKHHFNKNPFVRMTPTWN